MIMLINKLFVVVTYVILFCLFFMIIYIFFFFTCTVCRLLLVQCLSSWILFSCLQHTQASKNFDVVFDQTEICTID